MGYEQIVEVFFYIYLNEVFRTYQLQRLILRDCHWVTREAIEYHVHKQVGDAGSCHIYQSVLGPTLTNHRSENLQLTHVYNQGHGQVNSCLALTKLSAQCVR